LRAAEILETARSERRFELVCRSGVCLDHRRETDRKYGSAAWSVRYADSGPVHFNDTLDDRQAKPGVTRPATVAAPKPPEDLLALGARNAGSAIHDTQLALGNDRDLDSGAGCGMGKRVFDEVADCPAKGVGIAANQDRMVSAGDCYGLALRQRQRGNIRGDFGRDRSKVGDLVLADHKGLQLGDV